MTKIAEYINSLAFVVLCVLFSQSSLIIDTATLLYTCLPDDMLWLARLLSSCFGAFTLEAFLLAIVVNMHLFSKHTKAVPFVLGTSTTIMKLFFLEAFSSPSVEIAFKRVFVACMFGFASFMFGELFTKKWQEKLKDQLLTIFEKDSKKELELKLTSTEAELGEALIKVTFFEQELNNAKNELTKAQVQLGETQLQVTSMSGMFEATLTKLTSELEKYRLEAEEKAKKLSRKAIKIEEPA